MQACPPIDIGQITDAEILLYLQTLKFNPIIHVEVVTSLFICCKLGGISKAWR